jgi:hypothetical protein
MSDWVIAIPSFKRSIQIKEKTLNTLQSYHIPLEQIYIFVASDEEALDYKRENPDYRIVIGVLGLPQQRNFIMDYFEIGTQIVSLDDDIEGIYQLISKKEQTRYLKSRNKLKKCCFFTDWLKVYLRKFVAQLIDPSFFAQENKKVMNSTKFEEENIYRKKEQRLTERKCIHL